MSFPLGLNGTGDVDALRHPILCDQILCSLDYHDNWLEVVAMAQYPAESSCEVIIKIEMALNMILLCSAAYYAALRVYAIFEQQKVWFLATLAIGMINPICCLYIFVRSSSNYFKLPVPAGGCSVTTFVDSTGKYVTVLSDMIGGRATSIGLDGLVFCFTWWKTRSIRPSTIVAILNRDKIISHMRNTNSLFFRMTATLTSHFILDLRKVAAREDGEEFSEREDIAMLSFSEETTDSFPRTPPATAVVLDDIV
ncbi:hypothetical protein POSPLADRAFT_1148604 [Postia placenta MAD-698-R-SB12]|uniref:Uncharacterized protein n=1 Tax=Postia placenta MAD-698-R-SB12 TaxID=670580 RepID=A0A1X6MVY3_9APHY|nr:hypothetical protein POSPLADRAFT_1148604 [Postia placenta MAD-698-R-SB12]OSX60392.1 hypothetical protein POSPLADRAFT_1148604 [Postia placenta MAD-698-R-SB12]